MDSDILSTSLDEIISPRLSGIGLGFHSHYQWFSENTNSIRKVFKYALLKGNQGTFAWGVCVDFIPSISGSDLKYHRTEKSVTLHLFEWTDEYAGSFFGGKMTGGVISHSDINKFPKETARLLDRYLPKIADFYGSSTTMEQLISITVKQIQEQKRYGLHSPNPKFVMPFLLAGNHQIDKGISALNEVDNLNEDLRAKIEKILRKIGSEG